MKRDEIPKGIRRLTLSTSIRWFGWGLGEALIPIFLLLFSTNFLETGLLASVYYIIFFLSIPIAGYLADNFKVKKMLLVSLIIYIFIGLGYFLAGITSAIIFLIFARGLNGVAYSFDRVGRESYIMRHSPKSKTASIFGRFDFVTTLYWIAAVLIGLILIKFVPIHWLLFAIAPTSIIAFFIILKLKEKAKKTKKKKFDFKKVFIQPFKEIKNFNKGLKLIAIMSFFLGIFASIIYFFVPIFTYINEKNITGAVVITLAYTIPLLIGEYLGKIADKKKEKIYLFGFFALILILISFIYFKNYILILIAAFFASAILELIYLTNKGMITRIADRTHLGEVDGSLNGISALGAIIGPIIFGLLIDLIGVKNAYFAIILMMFFASIIIFRGRKNFKNN